jgi:hypothetical protein
MTTFRVRIGDKETRVRFNPFGTTKLDAEGEVYPECFIGGYHNFDGPTGVAVVRENLSDVKDVDCSVDHDGKPMCFINFELSIYHAPNGRYVTVSYLEFIDLSQPLTPQIERLQDQKRHIKECLQQPLTVAP